MIPAFATGMQDRELRGVPRDVYIWLNQQLDVVEFRPVKHVAVCSALGLSESAVFSAMELLVAHGYVKRGRKFGRIRTYRLVYSVPHRASGAA